MVIRPSTQEDFDNIVCRVGEGFLPESLKMSDACITAETREGKVAAIAGFSKAYEGCENVWMVTSDDARGNPVETFRAFRGVLDMRQREGNLFRIQALADPGHFEYNKFLKMTGFELEGLIRKATELQEDQFLYGRIW